MGEGGINPLKRAPQEGAVKITTHDEVDTQQRTTARQIIHNFLESHEPGIKVDFKRSTLTKAAEDMFTARGLRCPVMAIERHGDTYLINRDLVNESRTA